MKDTTECSTSALYIDILLKFDTNGKITNQLYGKRDDFIFLTVNFLTYVVVFQHHLRMVYIYLVADSVCKSLFDIRSVFSSRQSNDKQVDVTGV